MFCFRSEGNYLLKSIPGAEAFSFKLESQFRNEFWLGDSALTFDVFVNFGLRNYEMILG